MLKVFHNKNNLEILTFIFGHPYTKTTSKFIWIIYENIKIVPFDLNSILTLNEKFSFVRFNVIIVNHRLELNNQQEPFLPKKV